MTAPKKPHKTTGQMEYHYGITEAARRLGVSSSTLRRWHRQRKIHAKRLHSGARVFAQSELERMLRTQPRGITKNPAGRPPGYAALLASKAAAPARVVGSVERAREYYASWLKAPTLTKERRAAMERYIRETPYRFHPNELYDAIVKLAVN